MKKIIYSINIEDIQDIAEQEFGKKLTKKELKFVENKLGNYINWYEAINLAIADTIEMLKIQGKKESNKGF